MELTGHIYEVFTGEKKAQRWSLVTECSPSMCQGPEFYPQSHQRKGGMGMGGIMKKGGRERIERGRI